MKTALLFFTLLCAGCVAPYAQLSSGTNQPTSGAISFDSVDGIDRMLFDGNSTLTVDSAGVYLVIAAPQVTRTAPGQQPACGSFWLSINGRDAPNSSVQLCLAGGDMTDVVVSQGVFALNAGDTLQVKAYLSGVEIEAVQPPSGPLVPSIILTVVRQ